MSEIWKPVLGWEDSYEVSTLGRVRSLARFSAGANRWYRSQIVKPILGSRRYYVVNLSTIGRRKQYFLHKLVLEAFVGPSPLGHEACHSPDPSPANCSLGNLRWDTRKSNHADKKLHGTWQRGIQNGHAVLTAAAVLEIRSSALSGRQLARQLGVSKNSVIRCRKRITYQDIA